MANFSNWLELDNEIHKLECLRCNLDVIALGMNHDTMGEDKLAVESCAAMLGMIHERIEKLIWADRPKEVEEQ